MRYRFVEEHRSRWPVALQCEVLRVSRSGFYGWRTRTPSASRRRRETLAAEIREVHAQSRAIYGAPRVHAELAARGRVCDRKTVAKLMKQQGIRSQSRKRFRPRTTDSNHRRPVAPNRLDRDFSPASPNRSWVADITYVPTGEGWLYLAAVLDLYSRKVVGWSMSSAIDSRLVVDALEMAVARQRPSAGLLVHSDRGVQYASEHYQRTLARHGLTCSMSRLGNCWDNAPMESFFATLKTELVQHERYATRDQARRSVFEYLEVFYNRTRRHSALGYVSPNDFELAA